MAIDGCAPRAKMNQQRSRRFRAAKDTFEKTSEIKRLKEQIIANGGTVPADKPDSEKFDSNCITPVNSFLKIQKKIVALHHQYLQFFLHGEQLRVLVACITDDASI